MKALVGPPPNVNPTDLSDQPRLTKTLQLYDEAFPFIPHRASDSQKRSLKVLTPGM